MVDTQSTLVAALIRRTIGNHVVRHLLGQGSRGSVYLAEHPTIGQRIASRVLQAEFAARSETINRCFDIIDIVTLPAVPSTDPSFVYFFRKYIGGTSVTDLSVREGRCHARALAIALQSRCAGSIQAAHPPRRPDRDPACAPKVPAGLQSRTTHAREGGGSWRGCPCNPV